MPLATTHNPIPPLCHRADPRDQDATDRLWWLACCAASHEIAVATRLLNAGAPVLLPLCEYRRVTPSGKRRVTTRAVFPGYLFVAGDELDRLDALQAAPGRLRLIPIAPPAVPGLVFELSALLDAIDAGAVLGQSEPLRPGDRVKITGGMFEGRTGRYLRDGNHGTLWLEIAVVGRSVPVSVEDWLVEPIR